MRAFTQTDAANPDATSTTPRIVIGDIQDTSRAHK